MTPRTPDFRAILEVLTRNEVEFVLVGGVAVAAYGYVRATKHLDLVPEPSGRNASRLSTALTQMEARLPAGDGKRFDPAYYGRLLRRGRNATLDTKHGQIDVIQRLAGVPPWGDLLARAEAAELDGQPVLICSLMHLTEMKSAAGRPQDLLDLENLPDP